MLGTKIANLHVGKWSEIDGAGIYKPKNFEKNIPKCYQYVPEVRGILGPVLGNKMLKIQFK